MGLFGLLSIFCVVATAAANRHKCAHRGHRSDIPEISKNCLCPLEVPTIINTIDSNNTGVQRLVIFIYKKPNTGEIISYIPEKELQSRFPDFPEENGSINEISEHPSIIDLFEKSNSKEIRENAYLDETVQYIRPIIRPIPKNPNYVVVLDKQRYKDFNTIPDPYHEHIPSWFLPIDNKNVDAHPQYITYPDKYKVTDRPSDNITPYEDNTEYPATNDYSPYVEPEDLNEAIISQEDSNGELNSQEGSIVEVISQEDPEKPLDKIEVPSNYRPILVHPISSNKIFEAEIGSNGEHILDENRQDIQESSSETAKPLIVVRPLNSYQTTTVADDHTESISYEQDIPSTANPLPNIREIRVPLKDKYGRIIGWSSQTVKTYWEGGQHQQIPPIIGSHEDLINPWRPNHNSDVVESVTIDKHPATNNDLLDDKNDYHEKVPSFDYWLYDQLNMTTINGNKIPTTADDITILHNSIRNVLLQNGITVTKQGTLIDGLGNESGLDNLKLRPILIGKSISYNRFLKKIGQDVKFKIQSNAPYLEGLLLTMIKPAKFLGIVPLSVTSRPEKLGQDEINKFGRSASLKISPLNHLLSYIKNSQTNKERNTGRKIINLISKNNGYKTDSEHLRRALAAIVQKSEGRNGDRFLGKPIEDKSSEEEVPDFRIIGGISATVSGTPLLGRGRSGLEATSS